MRPLNSLQKMLVLMLLFLGMVSCAVERGQVFVVDDKRYCVTAGIWLNKWWQHYERGLSCAEGRFWDEAITSFKAALQPTRGQKDRWRVNTYGVHVLDDYFPHRELGIVYYRLGRYHDARRELEASLRTVASSKAKFYLNKTRKILSQNRDVASPRIVLDRAGDEFLTNQLTINVRGRADDDTYVAALTINGRPLFVELAKPRLPFSQKLILRESSNPIDIVATDLFGRQRHKRVIVHLDRHGPLLSLGQIITKGRPPYQRVQVRGFLSDASDIKRFKLANRHIPLPLETDDAFQTEISIRPHTTFLPFEAEDAAGNITRGEILLDLSGKRPRKTRHEKSIAPGLPQKASLELPTAFPFDPTWAPAVQQVARSHVPETRAPAILISRTEKARDDINCSADKAKEQVITYDNTIYFHVRVTDDSAITVFSIGGESRLRHPGRQLFFAYTAPLELQRPNGFLIEATDQWGNTARCEIIVQNETAQARQIGSRLRVFLQALQACRPHVQATTVDHHLLSALIERKRFFIIRERKRTIEGILEGTVCEQNTAETPKSLHVSVRYTDAETEQIELTEDIYGEDLIWPDDVQTLMTGLVLKVQRHFPLEEGSITQIDGRKVWTNLTVEQKVRARMKLLVFREGELSTGISTTFRNDILGEARLTKVYQQNSEAILLETGMRANVKVQDKVITK